jgi:membrane-associated PAP2 superfamily phosphatase
MTSGIPSVAWFTRVRPLAIFMAVLMALALAVSMLVRIWDVDLAMARLWWHAPKLWFGSRSSVCQLLNDYGPAPAIVVAIGAALVGIISTWHRPWRRLGPPALYLTLAFLLGPGLLVNGFLKHSWNRARPKDVAEFGGRQHYERVFLNEPDSKGRSFPSGHASAAFYLCSLGFAAAAWGRRENLYVGIFAGVAWGLLVGWARVASGAHFLSDIFWSAALVNAVNACILAAMIPWNRRPMAESSASTHSQLS